MGMIMKELHLSYDEIRYKIPWITLQKMIADLPRTEEISEDAQKDKELSPQTSEEFKEFINKINQKIDT